MDKLHVLKNYRNFKCKCDKCRHTCCAYWRINVSKSDYDRITALDNSLNHLVKEEYPTSKRYAHIKLDNKGLCPALDKGMCSLQIKYGVNALTTICMEYPRLVRYVNQPEIALSTSCEAVVESLFGNDLIEFENIDKSYMFNNTYSKNQHFIKHNKVRNKMFDYLYKDPNIKGINNIKDYLNGDINTEWNKSIYMFIKNIYNEFFRYRATITSYPHFMDNVSFDNIKIEDNHMIINLLINHMYYMNFPYCNNNENIVDNFIGLYIVYRLMQITFSILSDDILIDEIAFLFREIEHSRYYDLIGNLYRELI